MYPFEKGQNRIALCRKFQLGIDIHIEVKIITKRTITIRCHHKKTPQKAPGIHTDNHKKVQTLYHIIKRATIIRLNIHFSRYFKLNTIVLAKGAEYNQWQSDFRTPVKILFKFDSIFELNGIDEGRYYSISGSGSLSSVIIAPIVETIAKINTRHTQVATKPPL